MALNTIPETTPLQEPRKPKMALGIIAAASFLLGAATIYQAKTTVAASRKKPLVNLRCAARAMITGVRHVMKIVSTKSK